MREINITEDTAGQRFDKFLAKYMNEAPKSFIYKMLRKKNITLNQKKADGSEKLVVGDIVKLFLSDETMDNFSKVKIIEANDNIDIIYEDKDIIIVNKPVGTLSQKAEPTDISINEQIIAYLQNKQEVTKESLRSFVPSICNRLDRNTSGIILAGKTLRGSQFLTEIIKNRMLGKYYICIVDGKLEKGEKIEGYLQKNNLNNKVQIVNKAVEGADRIETEYEPIKVSEQYTRLRVKLITGKTHQIRAHLESIGHSILGDVKYNKGIKYNKAIKLKHQLLHAERIVFPVIDGDFSYLSGREFFAPIKSRQWNKVEI